MSIDSYYLWLGIPPEEQPPNHYRLLGINCFETNTEVISNSADRQMSFVRKFIDSEYFVEAHKLLNEIAVAKCCILNPKTRGSYDLSLQGGHVVPPPVNTSGPPINDSGIQVSQSKKEYRKKKIKAGFLGHLLAPVVGLALGWFILQYLLKARQESMGTSTPSQDQVLLSAPAPVKPKDDSKNSEDARIVQTTESPARKHSPEEMNRNYDETSSSFITKQIKALTDKRREAVARGDLITAIHIIENLASLEKTDVLSAKLDVLEQFSIEAAPALFAEQCLSVMNTAVDESRKVIALRSAELALIAARQSNDPMLLRKATQGVLRVRDMPNDAEQSEKKLDVPL